MTWDDMSIEVSINESIDRLNRKLLAAVSGFEVDGIEYYPRYSSGYSTLLPMIQLRTDMGTKPYRPMSYHLGDIDEEYWLREGGVRPISIIGVEEEEDGPE